MGNIDSQDKEIKPRDNPALTQTMSQSVKPNFTNQNLPQAQQQMNPQQAQLNELANFQHPHLVTQFDIQSRNLTTLEQIVSERLNSNKLFPEDDLMALLQGVLSALAFLQETGKGHGDIHPSTIYFDQVSGTFKINDKEPYYGRGAGYTQALQRIKFSFLSPELISSMRQQQFEVKTEVFYNSDIFAFGMVLLETATLKKSTECYDQHYTIMGNMVMDRINFLAQYYSQSFCSLLQVMLDFETRPSALQLWQNIINLLQQLDINEQKLVQQQQTQVQQRLVDDYYSQQSQLQPQYQPQYPAKHQHQVQPQNQHQTQLHNHQSHHQQQYQNQYAQQMDGPPQPNPRQIQQQQYSQQVQEPCCRTEPQQQDYTTHQQQQYQYQQPKSQQQQRQPQEEQYQYNKQQQHYECQPQNQHQNYQYKEQQQVHQILNPNCQAPQPPQQQQQQPQYVQQPQLYEREVKEVRYVQRPQFQEVECQQVPPQYQYHGQKVEIIQEQLQHGGYQTVSPTKSANSHQHISPSSYQPQIRQQIQYKQAEQENMYGQRTQQVSDPNGLYVLSSQCQNMEKQFYKPQESQNNIENLKQEIEKSKKLIENYQKKASDTKQQQYQVIVSQPQDSLSKKVIQDDTCVSSNLDDRIKQVIARSQAIRENFH